METKYLFKINKERFDALVKLRAWKYPISALSRRTGFSKSYCSQAIDGGISISDSFMLAMIRVSGASTGEAEEWAALFEITKNIERDSVKESFQRNNYSKYAGEKPYKRSFGMVSLSGQIRTKDKAKSLERLSAPTPIPAVDFYKDAIPMRAQAHYRYKR